MMAAPTSSGLEAFARRRYFIANLDACKSVTWEVPDMLLFLFRPPPRCRSSFDDLLNTTSEPDTKDLTAEQGIIDRWTEDSGSVTMIHRPFVKERQDNGRRSTGETKGKQRGMRVWKACNERWTGSLILALVLTTAWGCQDQLKVSDLNVQDLDYASVESLRTDPKLIKKLGPVVFLDIRAVEDYEKGHLPGAVNIPLPRLVGLDNRLANARTIVIYSDGWEDPLAPVAWKKMRALGYEGLQTFRGGVAEWVKQGRSLEEGPEGETNASTNTP